MRCDLLTVSLLTKISNVPPSSPRRSQPVTQAGVQALPPAHSRGCQRQGDALRFPTSVPVAKPQKEPSVRTPHFLTSTLSKENDVGFPPPERDGQTPLSLSCRPETTLPTNPASPCGLRKALSFLTKTSPRLSYCERMSRGHCVTNKVTRLNRSCADLLLVLNVALHSVKFFSEQSTGFKVKHTLISGSVEKTNTGLCCGTGDVRERSTGTERRRRTAAGVIAHGWGGSLRWREGPSATWGDGCTLW